jgi:hypothetical protein
MLGLLLVLGLAPAGRSDAPAGAITAKAADGPHRLLPAKPEVPAGELLTLLPGVTVVSAGGVALTCRADPSGSSPLPVLETAITLKADPAADAAVELHRGRLDLTNAKPDGPATVAVTVHTLTWTLTLDRPGARAAVEVAGRRPAGTRFDPKGPPTDPTRSAILVLLAGSASVSDGRTTVAMLPPPGPAQIGWTSTAGPDPRAVRLDRLPAWADPQFDNTADGRATRAAVTKLIQARAGGLDAGTDALLASKVPAEWRLGLATAAATDQLGKLAKVLSESPDPAVWDYGGTVLRHWLGRSAGQAAALFTFLTTERGYDPVAAGTVLDLLAGFTPAELRRPETYDALVEYLQHDKPAVRNLAAWHLVRLVPAGKAIPFRANAGKDELRPAYSQWKRLVPGGVLPAGRATDPPRPKSP